MTIVEQFFLDSWLLLSSLYMYYCIVFHWTDDLMSHKLEYFFLIKENIAEGPFMVPLIPKPPTSYLPLPQFWSLDNKFVDYLIATHL
jgi:hypothetical protein